jgi:multidrug transporter EmrE-like cation transporter
MDWTHLRPVLGAAAALFGIMLLALPLLRIAQRRLTLNEATGLLLAGIGFLILAAAAFVFTGEQAQRAVVTGVILVVAGNLLQRRLSRRP